MEIAEQLLSNFNLENVNLLSNPNVNPKNGVAYKKNVYVILNIVNLKDVYKDHKYVAKDWLNKTFALK